MDAKDWDKSVNVNVTATGKLIPFITPLLGSKGRAVFFDDPRAGEKFFGAYGATKAAQIALARSWQAETAKTGPQVHILTPQPDEHRHPRAVLPRRGSDGSGPGQR
jgi:NAD(P)-dependent dehydrogenase (short-subunit alcohol dehydrogenase family)